MSYAQITALSEARYAVVIDGTEEAPHLPFREMLVDTETTMAVAALAVGETHCIGAVQVRRVV